MKQMLLLLSSLLLSSLAGHAQVGGQRAFDFLQLPLDARLAALGSVNVSLYDQDVNRFQSNPALLNADMAGHLSVNYVPYYADIHHTALAYAFERPRSGMWGVNFAYHSYGTLPETDDLGNVIGEFTAADMQVSGSYAHQLGPYALGATVRLANSVLESYSAWAVSTDLGAAFVHPERDFTVGLTVRHLGYVFSTYSDGSDRPVLPLHIQLGTSYKPEYMPFRFSLTAHHLQQPDIVYLDPNRRGVLNADGREVRQERSIPDLVLRHLVFGGEFLLSTNFQLRLGYNHLINRELRLPERARGAGFSFGGMVRVKSFEFAFSRAFYHAVGGTSFLTVTSDLRTLFSSREKAVKGLPIME